MRGIGKKGQEMSISTLVLIVLAIIVLVIVVVGFTGGWSNLWDRITNLGGGKANVGLVVQACQIACDTKSQYDYCSQPRKVVFDDSVALMATCGQLQKDVPALEANKCYDKDWKLIAAATEAECNKVAGQTWNTKATTAKSKPITTSCSAVTC